MKLSIEMQLEQLDASVGAALSRRDYKTYVEASSMYWDLHKTAKIPMKYQIGDKVLDIKTYTKPHEVVILDVYYNGAYPMYEVEYSTILIKKKKAFGVLRQQDIRPITSH